VNLFAKKIPTILGVLVLLAGVFFGIWYVNSKSLDLSDELVPNDIRITNVADNKFVVSWTTEIATEGRVMFGKVGEKLAQEALDERDQLNNSPSQYITHYVTVKDLQPNTAYAFRIASGEKSVLFDNNGSPYMVTTGPTIASTPSAETIYGQVENTSTLPADGAIVYFAIPGAAPASALVKSSGSYALAVSTLRSADLKSYIAYDAQATIFALEVDLGKQSASAEVSMANSAPVPLITMGQSHDFREPLIEQPAIEEPVVAQIEPEGEEEGEEEVGGIFNVEPLANNTTNAVVTLTNPAEEGEVLSTSKPEFAGRGPAATVISLTVSSSSKTYKDTVAIPSTGSWAWSPSADLANGSYNINLAYIDSLGKEQNLKRAFSINTNLVSQPAFVATPSASIQPSPSATQTASPTATPRVAMPATDSAIPVTGVFENTFLTVLMATVIMISGLMLVAF
jgi:hypothetical protein